MKKIGEPVTEVLEVLLTDVEVSLYADKLARSVQDYADVDSERKIIAKKFNSQMARINGEIDGLAVKVKSKREYREVECVWELDTQGHIKSLIRKDTSEIVKSEVATDSDRQEVFFGKTL
jgi:hypothetical protein